MEKYFSIIAACISLVAMNTNEVDGCDRCGFRGRLCRIQQVQQVHHVAHVQHVAQVQQYAVPSASPEVLVVNNQYASPNGAAAFLAPQGNTVYGFQGAAQAYALDPTAVLRQAMELTKGAQQLASQGLNGYNQTASVALQLNAGTNDTIARGIAASSVLQSAGFTASSGQNQTQAMRIYRDEQGKWQVEQGESVVARITASVQGGAAATNPESNPAPPRPPAPSIAGTGPSMIRQHCASCHGLTLTQPKGGLFFDAGHPLDCKSSLSAVRSVMNGKMPKGQQLAAEVRNALVDELLSLTNEGE